MKKHGRRMMLAGGLGLLWLAMASDGGIVALIPTLLLGAVCIGLILLGDRFTRPRYGHPRAAAPAPDVSRPAAAVSARPAPLGRAA